MKRLMNRKAILTLLAVMAFAGKTAATEQPPNIVFILSDDQAWTDYGFMGHADIQTTPTKRMIWRQRGQRWLSV